MMPPALLIRFPRIFPSAEWALMVTVIGLDLSSRPSRLRSSDLSVSVASVTELAAAGVCRRVGWAFGALAGDEFFRSTNRNGPASAAVDGVAGCDAMKMLPVDNSFRVSRASTNE